MALGGYGWRPCREVMPKAWQATEQALKIDDGLVEAHAAKAYVRFHYDWDWPGAERLFRQAIELDPSKALTRALYAINLAYMQRTDDALTEAKHACSLEPLSVQSNYYLGLTLYFARHLDEALEQFDKVLELSPSPPLAHGLIGEVHLARGNWDESIKAIEHYAALTGESGEYFTHMIMAYAGAGRREQARELLDRMLALAREDYISPYWFIMAYLALGEGDKVLEHSRAACDGREALMLTVRTNPMLDRFRDTPWFQDMERMVGIWD
jgi:serine/threonine-protein kinase